MASAASPCPPPSESEVRNAIRDLTIGKTKRLMLELGVGLTEIDNISDQRPEQEMVKPHLVKKWLDSDIDASWEKLVTALQKIDMRIMAADVQRKYIQGPRDLASIECLPQVTSSPIPVWRDPDFKYKMKIVLCGDTHVGKTQFIAWFVEGKIPQKLSATTGFDNVYKVITVCEMKIKLQIWDTVGQERYEAVARNYYRGAHGIILMYDVTNEMSFRNATTKWLEAIKRNTNDNVKVVLVGNKVDLEKKRVVSKERGEELAGEHQLRLFETSSQSGVNVTETFEHLASLILPHLKPLETDTDLVDLSKPIKHRKTIKCRSE